MLPHPQATSTDHGGPRTSDLSIERRRRNHFTTAPLKDQSPLLRRIRSKLPEVCFKSGAPTKKKDLEFDWNPVPAGTTKQKRY